MHIIATAGERIEPGQMAGVGDDGLLRPFVPGRMTKGSHGPVIQFDSITLHVCIQDVLVIYRLHQTEVVRQTINGPFQMGDQITIVGLKGAMGTTIK